MNPDSNENYINMLSSIGSSIEKISGFLANYVEEIVVSHNFYTSKSYR